MKIVSMRNYSGRNIYSHKPVIKMILDLEEYTEVPTKNIEGFNGRLLNYFPGLRRHYCSAGYEGGFVQRLNEGTLISHVIEHIALELQCMSGYDVSFGKTRVVEEPAVFCIIYEYINQHCAEDFGYDAAAIALALISNDLEAADDILYRLEENILKTDWGPSTSAILEEAKKRHIPYRQLGEDSLFQLGYGKHMQFVQASLPGITSSITVDLAADKQLLKDLLSEQLIPVPDGGIAGSETEAVRLAAQIGYPVVVKPLRGNHGRGVTVNIYDERTLLEAYHLAGSYSSRVIIEEYLQGRDYRILVVGDRAAAAAERRPPFIIGNGIHSIAELVAEENNNFNRGKGHEKPLTKIYLDAVTREYLSRSGLTIDSIPVKDQIVYLRENGNLSTGGSARDCTGEIHEVNKELAVRAAQIINMDVAGIDMIMEDISRPFTQQRAAVIEVNAAPGLRMHLFPAEGSSRNVAADILDHMYPSESPVSIPVISITGTNGKTTVARMMQHVLSLTGKNIGLTCSSGSYIGRECISRGDNTGPLSARSILYNRNVEIAVLETARGGLIRKGLGYDLADIGIITNISDDHLGLDGIDTLEDLAFVKSLVVEAVKPDGYAVLNADDSSTERIMAQVKCQLILFSQNRANWLLKRHIAEGKSAIVMEDRIIYLYENNIKNALLEVDQIPITFSGQAVFNIENTLAVAAGLTALKIDREVIKLGLTTFLPDMFYNAGRLNLIDLGGFSVLLDYGHNLSGYKAVIQFAGQLGYKRLVGIIGMPGDRRNEAIYEVGKTCGQAFARIYIKEDTVPRGREPGVVAGILYHGALSGGAARDSIKITISESAALENAVDEALPGDLIVIFCENYETIAALVQNYEKLNFETINICPPLAENIYSHLPV